MIPDIGNVTVNNAEIHLVGIGAVGVVGVDNINVSNIPTKSIKVSDTRIANNNDARVWTVTPPSVTHLGPPVVVNVGTPIVNMPGCVQMHKENARNESRNKMLVDDDPQGNIVLCDSGMPNFIPPNYQADKLKWETFYKDAPEVDGGIDTGDPPVPPEAPGSPEPPSTPTETAEDPPCPGPMAPRIGDVAQNMKEKVSGFELQRDPRNPDGEKICVTLYEDIGAVEAFLPTPQVITTTATIAAVATGSALLAKPLADLLLKVVKPVIKKAMGFVKEKILKKKPPVLSVREKILKQRELTEAVRAARKLQGK